MHERPQEPRRLTRPSERLTRGPMSGPGKEAVSQSPQWPQAELPESEWQERSREPLASTEPAAQPEENWDSRIPEHQEIPETILPMVNGVGAPEFPQNPDLSSFFQDELKPYQDAQGKIHPAKVNVRAYLLGVFLASIIVFTINDIFTAWLVHFFK